MDEPVQWESSSSMNLNSELDQRINSSDKRQELEAFFKGAGWNVIKVIWGRGWDQLLAADKDDALVHVMNETLDGDYQTFRANDGAYVREHFFGRDPRTKEMVKNWTDDQLWELKRGGHDYRKVYAAYKAAMDHTGQPTVVLAHTIKGYALGTHFAGRNSTHQMKKLTLEDAKQLRDRLQIPITDEELERDPYMPPYYMPPTDHSGVPSARRQNGSPFTIVRPLWISYPVIRAPANGAPSATARTCVRRFCASNVVHVGRSPSPASDRGFPLSVPAGSSSVCPSI